MAYEKAKTFWKIIILLEESEDDVTQKNNG
jgi:hypothetical protein